MTLWEKGMPDVILQKPFKLMSFLLLKGNVFYGLYKNRGGHKRLFKSNWDQTLKCRWACQ